MPIRTLIVDDEPLAREGIALQLAKESDIDIVAQCENGNEAMRAIRTLKPDLVFLDIRMPKVSGFEVIEKIGTQHMPLVIFLTAYDEYAIEAFRHNALDYLLKPLDKAIFRESLQKARQQLEKNRLAAQSEKLDKLLATLAANQPSTPSQLPSRIAIKLAGQVHFLLPAELHWIESEGDYVNVHTANRAHLVRESMLAMERRLEPYGFLRIHRSAIINLERIARLVTTESGDYEVHMIDGLALKVGRNYRDALFARVRVTP